MIYTRFERARIIGARALQISMGAPPILGGLADAVDAMAIAVHEFASEDIPITVQRLAHAHR